MTTADELFPTDESYGEELKHDQSHGQDSISRTPKVRSWRRWATIVSGGSGAGHETHRGMKSRHLMMIGGYRRLMPSSPLGAYMSNVLAIGGTIGTGIFLSAGSVSVTRSSSLQFYNILRPLRWRVQAVHCWHIALSGSLYIPW